MLKNKLIFIIFLLLIFCSSLYALDKDILRYSGNIGTRFETNVSDFNYLPQNYASTYFNFNLSAGLVGLNLNGEFSTSEKRFAPEFIKKLGISPSIGCLHLDIGDHYPRYSKLVMSGEKVRGLSLLLDPGNFLLGLTGGRVRVGGAAKNGEYRREAYGLQLGYKSRKFELISQFSRFNDLPSDIDSIYKPQESLTAGVSSKLILPANIRLQGEFGYSYYTRDKRSEKLDTALSFQDISPEDFGITPRISSRIDYAYKYSLYIPIKFLQLMYQRDFIGPGYQTLGTPYMKNDILKDLFRVNLNLLRGKFFTSLMYLTQENNLNDEKSSTTNMDNYSISTRIRPVRFFSLRLRYANLNRDIGDTLETMQYIKNGYNITPEFRFQTGSLNNRISLGYSANISEYRQIENKTQTINLRYMGNLTGGLSFFADLNRSEYGSMIRNSYTLGASRNFREKNINISARLGFGDKLESTFSGNIQLPWAIQLNTSLSVYRLSTYTLKYRINLVRNF